MEIVAEGKRRAVQGLKTKGSSVLVNTVMTKGNHKKNYTAEDISSKSSVLEDQLIGGLDSKYDDNLLYDEVSDLLPPEIGASTEDLDDLFSAFGTAIEVIGGADQNSPHSTKSPAKRSSIPMPPKKALSWISLQAH